MTKKVLIYSKNLQAGGAERQLVYLATFLSNNNEVVFLVHEKIGLFVEELSKSGITTEVLKQRGVWRTSRELRKYIRKNSIDIVISYLPECNLINELATLPYKRWRVITGARSANPAFVNDLRLKIYYYAHVLADLVISNSEANKNDILMVNKLLRKEKVQVVYNIIKPPVFKSSPELPRDGRIKIVVAANYRQVKNLEGVLMALSSLSEEQRSMLHIDWYGMEVDDSLSKGKQFIQSFRLDDVITLHSSTDNVSEEYNKADVVGLFSHYEGLPNSLCEALVQGKMVICTPVSDMPLLLGSTNNIMVNSSSAEDIKKGFAYLITMSRDSIYSIGRDNAARFAPMFTMENIKQQILGLIQN